MIRQVLILSFLLHKKLSKKLQNSQKYVFSKIKKLRKIFFPIKNKNFWSEKIVLVRDFFPQFFLIFKKTCFREFWSFLLNFLCKRKLRMNTWRIKSFLPPPPLVFYLIFWTIYIIHSTLFFDIYWKYLDLNVRKRG